jgi:hypothetical protein
VWKGGDRVTPRPCERKCQTCGLWKHHSRFRIVGKTCNSTVSRFSPCCRDCEQKERNERKNADRPLAIIKSRAATAAHKAGQSTEFFMVQMNYRALIEPLRALMGAHAICQNCGHSFVNERDIQIDHIEPPRHETDWARLHARNLRFCCGSCNTAKGAKPFDLWLQDQEGARLSNLESPQALVREQMSLDF